MGISRDSDVHSPVGFRINPYASLHPIIFLRSETLRCPYPPVLTVQRFFLNNPSVHLPIGRLHTSVNPATIVPGLTTLPTVF